MALPTDIKVLLDRFSDADVVIVSLALAFVFLTIFYFVVRSLLDKFGIERLYGLPIPLFLATILAVLVIVSSLTSHPIACQACHPMKAASKELRASRHNGIICSACHKKASVMSLPIQKLEQGRMFYNYINGDFRLSMKSPVDNKNCLSCHDDVVRGVKTKFKVMVSHREIIEAGINCVDCHDGVAHSRKPAANKVSMMEKCSSCHNDEEASARCETCHLDSVWLGMKPAQTWGINHDENWPKLHGSRSLSICKSCHFEKDCERCHSAVPHPEGWPYIHGEEAKRNPEDCRMCHKEESLCRGCHKVTMPHRPLWINTHVVQERLVGEKVCLSCHSAKDCKSCHEKHVHRCGDADNEKGKE
ncbi:MAG: NapC/NirT family cytochrome c [Actinobacteria bacterium]|nr:NapC/NirT family cytochrome c [Actinomycetota bacterium]